jgi:hypothetical protein
MPGPSCAVKSIDRNFSAASASVTAVLPFPAPAFESIVWGNEREVDSKFIAPTLAAAAR